MSENVSKPKKKHTGLIVLLVIVAIIAIGCGVLFSMVDNVSELENHFDDVNAYKSQLVLSDEEKAMPKEKLMSKLLFDNITYNEESRDITLTVSKALVYNLLDLDSLNNSSLTKGYSVSIDKLGYEVDTDKKEIHVYAAVNYKGKISTGIVALLSYEFTDTDLVVYYQDVTVGKLPRFLYESKLPAAGKELFRKNISELEVNSDLDIKLLDPTKITDMSYSDGSVAISLNIIDAIENLVTELFGPSIKGSSKFNQLVDYYIGEMFNK